MEITLEQLKELRDKTGISVMQCKKALQEAEGDMEKAVIILKRKRSEAADKKADRTLGAGAVGYYIHNTNEVAGMVLLSSETDFVSKNEEFVSLANDIAMQVVAGNPTYISRDDIDEDTINKAKDVFSKEIADKPADMQDKIMEGKLNSYFKEQILLEQPFIKNSNQTIKDMIDGAVQKFGEKVAVVKISRLSVK